MFSKKVNKEKVFETRPNQDGLCEQMLHTMRVRMKRKLILIWALSYILLLSEGNLNITYGR